MAACFARVCSSKSSIWVVPTADENVALSRDTATTSACLVTAQNPVPFSSGCQ